MFGLVLCVYCCWGFVAFARFGVFEWWWVCVFFVCGGCRFGCFFGCLLCGCFALTLMVGLWLSMCEDLSGCGALGCLVLYWCDWGFGLLWDFAELSFALFSCCGVLCFALFPVLGVDVWLLCFIVLCIVS